MENKGLTVLSLFDGMSCGRIALERAGIKVDRYLASEIDAPAISIAVKNYPATEHLGAVEGVRGEDLPVIDLLIGGSPCQSFSNMVSGNGFEGKSGLFWEYVRVLREVRPRYFLLENVVMKKEWQDIISGALGVQPIKINSALVSAQRRNRLYWTNIPGIVQPDDRGILFWDVLEDSVDDKYTLTPRAVERVREKQGNDLMADKAKCIFATYYPFFGNFPYRPGSRIPSAL